jgi:uncharacterized membrane protein
MAGHYNDLMLALRYVYVLALAIWLGGMVVLGALVAPTIFEVLQAGNREAGRELAGELFRMVLARFHYVAYGAGGLLFTTLAAMAVLGPRPRGFAFRMTVVTAMLAVSLYSGLVVMHDIEGIQREVGLLPSRLPEDDARRIQFDQLHVLSTRLMLLTLAGALALVYWEARDPDR